MNKKEIIKYLKENELNIQSAHAAIIALDLVYVGYIDSDEIHGIKYSPIFSHICSKNLKPFYQIIPQKIITRISAKIYSDYCKNPKSLENKIKKHKELEKELEILWKKRSKIEALEFYKEFVRISREWWKYASIGEDKAEAINQEIVPDFAKRHNLDIRKAQELISTLSFPKEQSVFNLERKSFLEICLDFLDNKNLAAKIKKHIKNYFWFKTDFYKAVEITPKSLLKEVSLETKKRTKKDILKELKKIESHFRKIHKEKKEILTKLTKQDKKDIRFAELVTYWFDQRKLGTMTQLYYLFSFLKDTAKKYDLNYHCLADCTVEELKLYLETGKRISKLEENKREKGIFLLYEKNKKVKIFYGKDAQELFDIALSSEEKEIKGQVASTGGVERIKGKVRIVLNPAKDKFNKGEILVTSMTRIEFVPLMRKAKAIITNEGGIACHAAIVSRELNIPCIIGTKIATKLLKDGDLVEVDANKGIVKIIRK
jgi:phosphohistidine swiveling domain-containing protein